MAVRSPQSNGYSRGIREAATLSTLRRRLLPLWSGDPKPGNSLKGVLVRTKRFDSRWARVVLSREIDMPSRAALLFAVSSLMISPFALAAGQPAHLAVSLGAFGVRDEVDVSAMGSLQYYAAPRLFKRTLTSGFQGIGPILGLSANTDGGVFGYGGAYAALRVFDNLYVLPSAGIGGYARGHSKDLGGVFEFHLGAGLFYQLKSNDWLPAGLRFGVTYTHISNAFIHSVNPGADNLLASVSMPLSMGF